MASKDYCVAVCRALQELDKASFQRPMIGPQNTRWKKARSLLLQIIEDDGFDLTPRYFLFKRKTEKEEVA